MGGKSKQAQRTKNNVRPSSSGRSAELLSSSMNDPAFWGLGTGKSKPLLFPTLAAVNIEQGLNTEYSLCFKKFNKKDPVTRTKALQELLLLIKNGNADDVVTALPSWSHFYQIFTIDTNRKVRECAQACHCAIVRASGRRLAPHLRRVLPAWLLAQHDEHAPAQQLANASLSSTFPEGKLAEAISFCRVEIISLLLDNLMGNAEAMFSKKIENKEEKDIQVSHVIASSLRALELFTVQLPSAHDEWLWNILSPLLRNGAFWKLIQNMNDQNHVRAAWYGAVGRLMERFKEKFGAEYGVQAARALLALPERPPAAAQRWSALLLLMRSVQDWHTWFDKKDLLIKRILDVLENGGWGDAKLLSNLLLPLLDHLPQEVLTKDFYVAFFNAMFLGLEKKNILSSKSERQTWISNLADCLRYLSVQRREFAVAVGTSVHRTWLETVLAVQENQARNNVIKHSAMHMVSLVKFWLKRSQEENGEKYDQLLRNCWENIGSTISTQIDKLSANETDINRVMGGHVLLLQTLRAAFTQEVNRQLSITFAGDAHVLPGAAGAAVSKTACDPASAHRYKHNLNATVEKTCSLYFEFAHRNRACDTVLSSLITLLVEFESGTLYTALARHFGADSVYGFYDSVLRGWLADEAMRCEALVDVIFLLLKHLSEEEQDAVFDSFEQLADVAEWCLALCVSHPHCEAAAARRWTRGDAAQRVLLRLCGRALGGGDSRGAALLLRCVAQDERAESAANEDTINKIVQQVCDAILATNNAQLERRVRTAAQLAGALAAAPALAAPCAPLARALFALQLAVPRGDERLPLDTWLEVRSSWQDALASLPSAARRAAVSDMVSTAHRHLFDKMENLETARIENVVSLLLHVIAPADGACAPSDTAEVVWFTQQLFAFQNTDTSKSVEIQALRCDCIMGNLNCPFDDDSDIIRTIVGESSNQEVAELDKKNLMPYIYKYLFKAFYFKTILLRKSTEDEDEEETTQVPWCNTILQEVYFQEEFVKLLHDYMVLNTLNDRYGFWPHYEVIQQTKQLVDVIFEEIISETSTERRHALLAALAGRAATAGCHWSYARRFYEVKIDLNEKQKQSANVTNPDDEAPDVVVPEEQALCESEPQPALTDGAKKAEAEVTEDEIDAADVTDVVTGNGYFHSLQANLKWSEDEQDELRVRWVLALRSFQVAHSEERDVIDAQFARDAALCRPACGPDALLNAYYRHNHTMLYERDISTAPWAQVVSNAAVLDYLAAMVSVHGCTVPSHHWDFTTITLCSLIDSLVCSVTNWGCTKVAMVCRSALALWARVEAALERAVPCERERRRVLALLDEWHDIFAPAINEHLFKLIITILECRDSELTCGQVATLGALLRVVPHLQWERVPAPQRSDSLCLQRLCGAAGAALRGPAHGSLKLLAARLLRLLAKPLVASDEATLTQWSAGEGVPERPERPALSLWLCTAELAHLQELVDAALSSVSVCEEICEVVPFSDSHNVALGYLLLAVALFEQCELAKGDLVHHYVHHVREHKFAEYLLPAALRLLPAELARYAQDATGRSPQPAHLAPHFLVAPEHRRLTAEDVCAGPSLGKLACRAVLLAVGGVGAAGARGWWGAAPPRAARAAQRVVTSFVAPLLVQAELRLLKRHAHELPDAEVSIQWSSGEARCALQVEERELELCVRLAPAHPLQPPRLSSAAVTAAPDTHWLTMYLTYQNGRLLNAFKMWIRAVTARIESAPQCYICYCRLHPGNGRLPTVPCHQCRNKFHPPCLRRWFTTSNKSNCPLCRSNF